MLNMLGTRRVLEMRASSRTALHFEIRNEVMVPPFKRGGKNLWLASEIEAMNRAEASGASAEHLRRLVRRLLKERQAMAEEAVA